MNKNNNHDARLEPKRLSVGKNHLETAAMSAAKPLIKVMLDSGAYSAWTHGKTINLRDYIKFIREVEPCLRTYVNLDMIPGSLGRSRTWEDAEGSAAKSYRNWQMMKDAGLKPLPVFHQGEDFRWLEKMLKDGEDYIGISTAKNQRRSVQQQWLDIFFATVTDELGRPLIKVHGFGSAHVDWLRRYPFYSVDTAGWLKAAAYGKLYVPPYVDGAPDYWGLPELVSVTSNFKKSKYGRRRQLSNPSYYGPRYLEAALHFIEHEAGLDFEHVRSSSAARAQAMAVYYQRVRATIADIRFQPLSSLRPHELRIRKLLRSSRQPINLPPLQFVFATGNQKPWRDALRAANADYHLLSYWKIGNRPQVLEAYVMKRSKVMPNDRTSS
jgi:hypothetical protein